MRGPLTILAACILFAGCMDGTSDQTSTTSTTTGPPPVPAAFTVDYTAAGCFEAIGILLVDPAVAQAALPANWTAADVQDMLEVPAATGRAGIWFNAYTCANATVERNASLAAAEFGILVEAPTLANATYNTTALNVYQLLHATDSNATADFLARLNITARDVNVTVERTGTPVGPERGTVRVANASAPLYSFGYTAAAPDTFTGQADFWHETPDGLAVFHFDIAEVAVLGGIATECAFTDPAVRQVTQTDACPPGTPVLIVPQQAWEATFHWLPGAHAITPA